MFLSPEPLYNVTHVSAFNQLRRLLPWNLVRALDELKELPQLRTQLDQCLAIQRLDTTQLGRLEKALKKLGHPSVLAHVRAAVDDATVDSDPCPHIVVDSILPDDVYDELLAALPPRVFFEHMKVNRQDLSVPFELAPRYHREVWATFQRHVITEGLQPALAAKFRSDLDALVHAIWPTYGSLDDAGITLERVASRLMRRGPGYEIKPHRDPRWAFLTCILYLTRRDDVQTYGTQLCRLTHERAANSHSPFYVESGECEVVHDVPGRPNTAVVFLNSSGAHRASIPQDAPPDTDRYVYQLQLGPHPSVREVLIGALPEGDAQGWSRKTGKQTLKH